MTVLTLFHGFVARRVSRVPTWTTRVQRHVSVTSGHAIFKTQMIPVFYSPRTIQTPISDWCVCKPERCPISLPYTGLVMLIPVWKVRYAFIIFSFAAGKRFWNFNNFSPKLKEKQCYQWNSYHESLFQFWKISFGWKNWDFHQKRFCFALLKHSIDLNRNNSYVYTTTTRDLLIFW